MVEFAVIAQACLQAFVCLFSLDVFSAGVIVSRKYFDDISGAALDLLLKESRKVDFPDEAYPLRVLFVCGRQLGGSGDFPDFGFEQMAYRKEGF